MRARHSVHTSVEPEATFMAAVIELAMRGGWLVYHDHDSRRNVAGLPDLLLVRPPRVLFAELKSARGNVRPAQRAWLDALAACPGVECHLWRPAN